MKKLILGSFLGLLCALPLAGMSIATQDDITTADAAKMRFTELEAEAKEAYSNWRTEMRKKFDEAKERGEEVVRPLSAENPYLLFIPRFEEAASDYADTEDAVQFLVWVAQIGRRADVDACKRAVSTLFDTHVQSPGLAPLARYLGQLESWFDEERAKEFIDRLEMESTVPEIRGWAAYARLSDVLENAALDSNDYEMAKKEILAVIELIEAEDLAAEVNSKITLREKFSIGMVAPDITGIDLDGVAFKLSDYKGKILFVDFWGDW